VVVRHLDARIPCLIKTPDVIVDDPDFKQLGLTKPFIS